MDRLLTVGSTGSDVSELQGLLNRRPPTQLPPLRVDNIFGPKTAARVSEFQRNNGLKVDGVAGPQTLAKLRALQFPIAPRTGLLCNTPDPANVGKSLALRNSFVSAARPSGQVQLAAFSLPSLPSLPGLPSFPSLPSLSSFPSIRPLTAAQTARARNFYGSSLDFPRIFISNQTGAGGRPFTVAVTTPLTGTIQIMNCGTFNPSESDLIHELAHVWQSQHHSDPTQFMANAVNSQAAAVAANGLEVRIDRTVLSNADFPVHFPFSAYAFVPGKPFGEYAAEQIANGVEHGDRAIITHVRSVSVGVVDRDNQTSLATTRIGDRRTPGIVF